MMQSGRNIFLTGATGFIGGRLLQRLAADSSVGTIRCLVRDPSRFAASWRENPRVIAVRGDITDRDSMLEAVRCSDLIFHLAAFYELGIPRSQVERMENINIGGTENILSLAKSCNVPRVVYVSTVYALGDTGDSVADESLSHCGRFTCHYERTKYEAHQIANRYARGGLPLITVLPSAVYGDGDPSVIGLMFEKLISRKVPGVIRGTENGKLTYVHVDDLVQGILLAEKQGRIGESYILSSEAMTMNQTYQLICELAGVPAPKRKIPLKLARLVASVEQVAARCKGRKPFVSQEGLNSLLANFSVSSEKARRELGFRARSNREGFAQTIASLNRETATGG